MLTHDCRNSVNIQPGFGRDSARYRGSSSGLPETAQGCGRYIGFLLRMLSTLFTARITGALPSRSFVQHHFRCVQVPSTTKITSSTSPIELLAALFIRRLMARFSSICRPGVSLDRLIRAFSMDPHNAVTSCLRLAEVMGNFLPSSLFQDGELPNVCMSR